MSHSCLPAGRRVLGAASWGHQGATSLLNFNIPKRRTTPSAAPVTSKLPLWLKAVQLMAMGSGSRENCSWKGKSALMLRNRAGGAEECGKTVSSSKNSSTSEPYTSHDYRLQGWQLHFTGTLNQQFTSAKPQLSQPWPQGCKTSFWQALA